MNYQPGKTLGCSEREVVLGLLALRRDERWRRGVLQCATSVGIFRHDEWAALTAQLGDPVPSIPVRP
jgi:hypothetical protein